MGPRKNLALAILTAILGYLGIIFLGGPVPVPWPDGTIWAPGPGVSPTPGFEPGRPVDQSIEGAIRVQSMVEDALFEIDQVLGLGVGWTADGRTALRVFVEPGAVSMVPSRLGGLPVVVSEAGPFYAGVPEAVSAEADDNELLPTSRFDRPVPVGISTGHLNSTAGTIGAVVTDGLETYALSNWHVFVPAGQARVGDPLLQPGPYDGGANPADVIGTLAAFEPVKLSMFANNRIDAAIARTDQVSPFTPSNGYGTARSETMKARPGLRVQKYGRTTGHTFGQVESINTSINVTYGSAGSQVARFTGQVIICCSFSAGGDSGSLIVAHDVDDEGDEGPNNRKPVALLFAGDRTRTIANPIDLVLDRFGVTIVEGER
ncbi:MAG: hypothetical protein R3195_01905 [Gemmatimonadota bacterium]|nr:hypothetical protein [Gemmatimonadota bacterium]